ncbi:uncharacterized protein LOC141856645 [Brevipalpus obovatus]|uniref:uncharacterized protein LOC141856645 n=1 Tax=Brevipalpus obovatus TaxID=246614 RepID=UPI003D9F92AF
MENNSETNEDDELFAKAPIAKTEEWSEVGDLLPDNFENNSTKMPSLNTQKSSSNFGDTFSNSLEDLVNSFDEKLTKCFLDYKDDLNSTLKKSDQEEASTSLGMDRLSALEREIELNQSSHLAIKQEFGLDLGSIDNNSSMKFQSPLSDNMDLQSLNIDESSLDQHSIDSESTPYIELHYPLPCIDRLTTMSLSQLYHLNKRLTYLVHSQSETLLQNLNSRDELRFERELRSNFVSLLLEIQNKRQCLDHRNSDENTKYLTTVIPYNPSDVPLSIPTIQILSKILDAMNKNSPAVPNLLTDFILKVLCPT